MTARIQKILLALLICLSGAVLALAESHLSVREIMVSAITPATNTLWGVGDPQADAEWQALDDAAVVVIASASLIADGGTGPSDDAWAAEDDWQAWTASMRLAASDARAAIAARDLDALLEATDVMYPPCEECHLRYHPGVQ